MIIPDLATNEPTGLNHPYQEIREIVAPESGVAPGLVLNGLMGVVVVTVNKSGFPVGVSAVQAFEDEATEFDPVLQFRPDGQFTARLDREAPPFKVAWDF